VTHCLLCCVVLEAVQRGRLLTTPHHAVFSYGVARPPPAFSTPPVASSASDHAEQLQVPHSTTGNESHSDQLIQCFPQRFAQTAPKYLIIVRTRLHKVIWFLLEKWRFSSFFCQTKNVKMRLRDLCAVNFTWLSLMSHFVSLKTHWLHCVPKNWTTKLMAVTLSNLNRFSKFFHC